jgi:hypothetical protein
MQDNGSLYHDYLEIPQCHRKSEVLHNVDIAEPTNPQTSNSNSNDCTAAYLHPICGCFAVPRSVGCTAKTALSRADRERTRSCRASRWFSGTETSIMSEKYDGPKRPATLSPTLPPAPITAPVTSDTIPRRSTPAALMIKWMGWDALENSAV